MKITRYISVLILLVNTLSAQSPFFKFHDMEDPFKRTPAEVVFEDHNSSLWFGSKKGLFLYDGIEFHHFAKEDTSSNHVRAIFRDSNERLWIGYADGTVFYFENQKLKNWKNEDFASNSAIVGFVEDDDRNIWMATFSDGIYGFSINESEENIGNSQFHINVENGLPCNIIHTITASSNGQILVGSDCGIISCTFPEGQLNVEHFTTSSGLPNDTVTTILKNEEGALWLGFNDGNTALFNLQSKLVVKSINGENTSAIKSIELFEGTELWIGTNDNGLWRYSLTDDRLLHLSSFSQSKIHDLHKDIEGNIWVLTHDQGIHSANRQFEFISTKFEKLQAVLCDSKSRLWVGTKNGFFEYRLDKNGMAIFQNNLPNNNIDVTSLYEDKNGIIWIGTVNQGLFIFNPSTKEVNSATFEKSSIQSITGSNGHIYAATSTGVLDIENENDIFSNAPLKINRLSEKDGLESNTVYTVFADSKDRVWFGTGGQIISFLENGKVNNLSILDHFHSSDRGEDEVRVNAIYSITEDLKGHIWFGTDRAGIFEFDGQKFHHLDLKEGIRDLEIIGLATDGRGQILIVHPSGVDLLTPETRHLIYYDDEVGIKDFSPSLNAICTDELGSVWIAGKNAIIKYTTLKEVLEIHPRTTLSVVSVLLEPIDFHLKNIFSFNENHLAFNYMGLWYTDPQIVKYRYQLVGYDFDWIESKDRRATYSNLPPGNYTFKVTSTENDAWSDEPIVSYDFKIRSPIWMRWWFIALLIPTLLGLFFLYQKNRDRRIQLVNLMEKDKAESKLATLKAQINPHFLFNSFNTLISVVEKSPDQAVEYIENLSDFYRKIMQLRDKDIISVQEEVELLKNYKYLLKKRYGNNFHLVIDLPAKNWYIVPLTFQLLVENAVKHNIISKNKPLTVKIESDGIEYFTVTNNLQLKLTQETSTNFGLQSLIQRYGYLNKKKVKVEQNEDSFKVSIPVII